MGSRFSHRGLKRDIIIEKDELGQDAVTAASSKCLILSLLETEEYGSDYAEAFLLTFEYWISSHALLEELISTFYYDNSRLLEGFHPHTSLEEMYWKNSVRKRVIKLLYFWYSEFPEDFDEAQTLAMFIDFVFNLKKSNKTNIDLSSIFTATMRAEYMKQGPVPSLRSFPNLNFLDINPQHLAEQMTYYEFNILNQLHLHDFRHRESKKKGQRDTLHLFLNRVDMLKRWILTEILTSINARHRRMKLINFVRLCHYTMDLKNYSLAIKIKRALDHPLISFIQPEFQLLPTLLYDMWRNIQNKTRSEADYFDHAMESSFPKMMPITLCLKYIKFQELEPSNRSDHKILINFSRLRGIAQILKAIKDSKKHPFHIKSDYAIQQYLDSLPCLGDDQLKALSLHHHNPNDDKWTSNIQKMRDQRRSAPYSSFKRQITPKIVDLDPVIESPYSKKHSSKILLKTLKDELRMKWERPLDQCSVGADLPRLVANVVVVHMGTLLIGEDPDSTIPAKIKELLYTLCHLMDAKKEQRALDTSFHLFFGKENGDMLKESDRFAKEVFGDDSRVCSLLKASTTQGILSPGWILLKLNLLSEYRIKDQQKGWKIALLFEEDHIVVVHRKDQISCNAAGEELFGFTWELTMKFTKRMEKMVSANMYIVQLTIIQMGDRKASNIKSLLKGFYHPKKELYPRYLLPKKKK